MTAENIILLIVFIICSILFIAIGISQIRSKEPVSFLLRAKPPAKEEVLDLAAYNKKHGIMWIVYGIGIMLSFLFGTILGESIAVYASEIEMFCGACLMLCYHNYLDKKYVAR